MPFTISHRRPDLVMFKTKRASDRYEPAKEDKFLVTNIPYNSDFIPMWMRRQDVLHTHNSIMREQVGLSTSITRDPSFINNHFISDFAKFGWVGSISHTILMSYRIH